MAMTAIAALKEMLVIAVNNTYRLRILQPSDREAYFKTMRETAVNPAVNDLDYFEEAAWRVARNSDDEVTIPIERKSDLAYLGQFLLKQRDAHTIEIGLDLMVQYQSRGIGTEVTALLLAEIHRQYPEYIVIAKAYSDNVRSNLLIQHMGGVKMKEEPTEYEAALAVLHRVSEETGIELPESDDIIPEGHINVYRL